MSKEVLIVEDDRALAKGLERAIGAEGYGVRIAYDGVQGLEEIRNSPPGLVLLDLLLPKRDGHSVLEQLRSNSSTQDLPVVVMTGVFRGRDHQRSLEQAGAQGFLEKPFRKSDLMPHLKRHLGRPGARRGRINSDEGEVFSLAVTPVAEVLWSVMSQGLSGGVILESGKRRKVVLLDAGRPLRIRSNLARECLGNRLLASGRIDAAALKESLARARQGEGKQGEVLVQLGAVSEAQVQEALAEQAEEKLLDVFSWNDGEAQVQTELAGDEALTSELPDWSPREVIIRGARMMAPRRVARILSAFADEPLVPGPAALTDEERAIAGVAEVLDQVDEGRVVGDISAEHAATVYGLRLIGAVAFGDGERESAGGATGRRSDLPGAEELRELLETQKGQTHFEVLGLTKDAGDDEIRSGFLQLAKRLHPDRFSEGTDSELATELFGRITQAHETLGDPDARVEYLKVMRGGDPSEGKARVTKIMSAEAQFQQGLGHFKKREYGQALEKLKWAVEMNPDEGEFQALYGWAYFLANRGEEDAGREALAYLRRGVELAPMSATGRYYFGMFRKACGKLGEAERMFRKALELDQKHAGATQELRLMKLRKRGGGGGDGLKGLLSFGRKKK